MPDNLAIIIPTYNRENRLIAFLKSIKEQSVYPQEVIIVDASVNSAECLIKGVEGLNVRYIRSEVPCLTKQRNIGISNVSIDIDIVGFLDDDVILCNNAIDNMISFWRQVSDSTGGVSFNIIDNPLPSLIKVKKLFSLDSSKKGKLLRSSFNSSLYPVVMDMRTQWLSGACTIWRKELLDKFKYDENLKGYGLLEDVDFSYRAGKQYDLFVLGNAQVKHLTDSVPKRRAFQLGLVEVLNRYYFLSKHKEFSILSFYWAFIGLITLGVISSIKQLSISRLKRALGNVAGVCSVLILKGRLLKSHKYSNIKN